MTYAMKSPSQFGEFLLECKFVGWKETLREYLPLLPSEVKERYEIDNSGSYAHLVSLKFDHVIASEANQFRGVPPLEPYECPTEIQISHMRGKPPGSLVLSSSRLPLVDAPLRAIIEEFEPDIHQFWPVKILLPDGSEMAKKYFGIRIGSVLDSFLPDLTPEDTFTSSKYTHHQLSFTRKSCASLAMSKEHIGSTHFWRERILKAPCFFLSDAFVAKVKEAGLRIPTVYRVKEI